MNIKKYTLRKTIGGISIMTSMLLLLIGLTQYDTLFSSAKYDLIKSSEYAKTAIQPRINKQPDQLPTFNLDSDGDIIKTYTTPEGELIEHYRAIYVPELINNYDYLPKLYLEVIRGREVMWKEVNIYKVDREKGNVYFLLKVERNSQTLPTNLYTGRYKVELIK